MMRVKIRGAQRTRKYLKTVRTRATSDSFWQSELMDIARVGLRFACSISPVITGRYRGAHELILSGKRATWHVSPTARNVMTGMLVSEYAAAVEARHQVYARTAAHLDAELDRVTARLVERLLDDN